MFALALWTSFVLAVALTGSLYAVPALVVIGPSRGSSSDNRDIDFLRQRRSACCRW
jgi:hypothetical protein